MIRLLFTFLAIAVIFSACKKEEEIPTNNTATTYAFSCKIAGADFTADFTDNTPVATVDPSTDVFTLVASNGSDEVRIYIYNFSTRTEGDEITLLSPGNRVYVTLGTNSWTNTISGKFIFSKTESPISGTFNAQCNNLQTFQSVTITDGEFIDVAY